METIDYDTSGSDDFKKLFDMSIFTGKISLIDFETDTCALTIDQLENKIYEEVPIYYHCEGAADVEGGSSAFEIDDKVYITNEYGKCDPNVSDLKVVGFTTGLKVCQTIFYLRVTIDGHQLKVGGQKFSIRYTNNDGDLVTSDPKWVHGKQGDGDTEKYYFCGPFDITGWDNSEPVGIYLDNAKGSAYMDPAESSRTVEGQDYEGLMNMFEYYIQNDSGDKKIVLGKDGKVSTPLNTWYPPGCGGGTYEYRTCRSADCSIYMDDADTPSQEYWPHTDIMEGQWYKVYSDIYEHVASLYKEFSGSAFRTMLQNTETRIYNWDTGEYEDNPRVIIGNLQFDLQGVDHVHEGYSTKKIDGGLDSVCLFECVGLIGSSWFDENMVGGAHKAAFHLEHTYNNPGACARRKFYTSQLPVHCVGIMNRPAFGSSPQEYEETDFHNFQDLFLDPKNLFHVLSVENGAPSDINYSGSSTVNYADGCLETFDEPCENIISSTPVDNGSDTFTVQMVSVTLDEPYF